MGFKEQMHKDFQGIFENLNELGEAHTINGKEVSLVVDADELTAIESRKVTQGDGIFSGKLLFFVQKEMLGFEPFPGQYINFDGNGYLVDSVKEDIDSYTVVLEANED